MPSFWFFYEKMLRVQKEFLPQLWRRRNRPCVSGLQVAMHRAFMIQTLVERWDKRLK